MPLETLTQPITSAQIGEFSSTFDKLQGNILRGHGRDHVSLLFVKFTKPKATVTAWIKKYAAKLTSASQQMLESKEFADFGLGGTLFRSLLLTSTGYQHLGFAVAGFDAEYQAGAKAAIGRLNDPAVTAWDPGLQDTVHALFILADDDRYFLDREARALGTEIAAKIGVLVDGEAGHGLRNENEDHIEHFGYVDGRSQPLFFKKDVDAEAATGGIDRWDPSAGPNLVLVRDPLSADAEALGSYFVFRKLEQNVRGFKQAEQALGLLQSNVDREIAGAQVVGRFENGAPVVIGAAMAAAAGGGATSTVAPQTELPPTGVPNNFNYAADASGSRCPFQSHIRKTNPRGDSPGGLAFDNTKRIARRGIPYGDPVNTEMIAKMPTGGRGLLFMCYQKTISGQFEFMQSSWANNINFKSGGVGVDPVIGQDAAPPAQDWPNQWGGTGTVPFTFEGFVTMRGGEYFFAPSLPFLKKMA